MDRLELMKTFTVVVARGSFSDAARDLGVTRALVSKRVQNLETGLGAKLINRSTRRMSTTAAGQLYFEESSLLLAQLAGIEERVSSHRRVVKGDLRILSSKTFGETVLAPLVSDFCVLYPEIDIQLTIRNMAPASGDLTAGGFDLAFRTIPPTDSALVSRAVIGLPRVLVASPSYLKKNGTPADVASLKSFNCLDPSGTRHVQWEFREGNKRHVVRVSGSPRANSSTVICHAAVKGLGIAMLREYLISEHLKSGALVKVLHQFEIDERKLYLLSQRNRFVAARNKLFVNFVIQNIRKYL